MEIASFHATDTRKRPHAPHASSSDCVCINDWIHGSSNKRRSFHDSHEVCTCAVTESQCHGGIIRNAALCHTPLMRIVPPFSVMDAAEYKDTADSSTGSSCCSSLPENETSLNEQQTVCCVSDAYEAESCCGGEDPPEMDIACFLHDAAWDDANNESFSFDPETIFLNDAGYADCNSEAASLDCSADNGSWFLNELDGHGETFLNEVLDQEWMAAAVANLEKLNDTLNADSCVMHLLESDELGKEH